jgi:KaiC/GvpD/RAD55 family RecA-like ATPase
MPDINSIDYEQVSKKNLQRAINRKKLDLILKERLKTYNEGSIVVIQTPAENYLETNISSVKSMVDNGYEGIYLSFQRPFKNITSIFEKNDIDLEKIFVVDCASVFSNSNQEPDFHNIDVDSCFDIDNIVEKICKSIGYLKSDKKFVFVDSLSTLALHKSLSETLRFSEYMINKVKRNKSDNVTFIFNVAKELGKKRFIQNINVYADEHIHLGLCT